MDVAALREWAGIGKDLAVRILELATTGDCAVRQELLQTYPITLLDVLALQGVGPKTAGRLYQELGSDQPRRSSRRPRAPGASAGSRAWARRRKG